MDSGLLPIVIPALLALVGTVFGLWLGQRRWAAEHRLQKRRAFDARRHDAYEELWKILENAHIALRTGRPDAAQVRELDQAINGFRLQKSVLLEPEDMELSNAYFNSIVRLATVVSESGSRELEEQFERTNTFTEEQIGEIRGLAEASETASRLRAKLIERVRAMMLETSYAVAPD